MRTEVDAQSSGALYGAGGVSPMAVRQGTLGSCYFHASIAAIAKADPAAIRRSLSGNAKSGYKVRFSTGPEELVYAEDVEYGKTHSYDESEGEWVTVLMRGFAQRTLRENMRQAIDQSDAVPFPVKPLALAALEHSGPLLVAYDRAIRAVVSQDGHVDKSRFETQLARQLDVMDVIPGEGEAIGSLLGVAGVYQAIENTVGENGEVFGAYRTLNQGGIPARVLRAWMGNAKAEEMGASNLASQLGNVHQGTAAMVARTKPAIAGQAGMKAPDWYIAGHAYTVLDFDSAGRTVELRNPWGAHPGPAGIFRIPLSQFQQAFSSFTYSVRALEAIS